MNKKLVFFSLLLAVVFFVGAGCLNVGDNNQTITSGPAGMYLSIDKGESWTAISSMPTNQGTKNINNMSVYALFEDPQDPQGLYWASREGGLFYTFDSGKSWQQSGDPLNVSAVRSVAINPRDKCTIYATNGRQVFKTIDCVRSWEEVFREIRSSDSITYVAFDPFHPENIYISESNGDVLKSIDGGVHWLLLKHFSDYVRSIDFDTNNEGLVYITTLKKGLFRSKDFGETWTDLSSKLKDYSGALDFKRFVVYPSQADEIYWISKYGVLTSRNAGEDWESVKLVTPPGSVDIYGFAVSRSNDQEIYYTGTINSKSSLYRSIDGGKTWETRKLPSKQIPTMLYAHPQNEGWLYLGFTIPPKN
ncbi:MAG: hypothetical protein AUJ23_01035 [Candidatus Magasanikbacteria bacterium CG1_02_32_51]|uniref:Sortilin N-terminal domain-containing protein n=1 Tax=Candidatus Magasanikbacteria bacterium CG1_02_32_51 TaxID=1805238 RepID=A0A1J4U7W0_9BACT|nr:MAG: hypothetical protein AUJ23_01035 [Candidatus Magasanikbacteria bacterium CG1_02_32_51]